MTAYFLFVVVFVVCSVGELDDSPGKPGWKSYIDWSGRPYKLRTEVLCCRARPL